MADPHVRELGTVEDLDGVRLVVDVDYDTVVLSSCAVPGAIPRASWRLTSAQAEEFAQLFVSACWQAARQVPGD